MVPYGFESRTLTLHLGRRIQAFENKRYRRMLVVSTKNTKQTDIHRNMSVSLPGIISSYGQPQSVVSYHGWTMSAKRNSGRPNCKGQAVGLLTPFAGYVGLNLGACAEFQMAQKFQLETF